MPGGLWRVLQNNFDLHVFYAVKHEGEVHLSDGQKSVYLPRRQITSTISGL